MRWGTVFILLSVCISLWGAPEKKLQFLAGYTNVQILKVDHRGLHIMHNTGVCTVTVDELTESEKKLLAAEVEQITAKQKQYKEYQAKLKKQRAQQAKESKAALKKATDAQNKEVNALVKQFSQKKVYEILRHFEAKFGLTKNARNMGLRGRVKSVVSHIERAYPLAKKSKQSFQPKPAYDVKIEKKTGKDGKVSYKKTRVLQAPKEMPVMMNALSKSIVLKRIALEGQILSKNAAKAAEAEAKENAKDGGGDEAAPAAENSESSEAAGGDEAGGGENAGGDEAGGGENPESE